MSSRKENVSNKTSATKYSASKRFQTAQGHCGPVNLNNTFANIPLTNHYIKRELSATVVHTPSVDYDLQCDLAYSNYLQALLCQQYMTNKMKEHSISMNDQLSKYADLLSKKLEDMNELEQCIKKHEIQTVIEEFLLNLESKIERNLKEFPSDTVLKLSQVFHRLEYASNHLYLDKVKTLENQEEYEHLESLLNKCCKILANIVDVAGDTARYQNLNDCLSSVKNAQKEIATIEDTVKTLEGDVSKLVLRSASDILFDNNNTLLKDMDV